LPFHTRPSGSGAEKLKCDRGDIELLEIIAKDPQAFILKQVEELVGNAPF